MNLTTFSPTHDVSTFDDVTGNATTPNVTSSPHVAPGMLYALPPRELHYYHVIYLSVAIAVGVPGNVVVISSYSSLRKKTSCDWYILYIGVLDLIICLIRVPTHLAMETGHWQQRGTDGLCKFVYWLSQSVITASVFLFGFIAIDRFIKVCKHTVTITPSFSRNCILIISTVSLLSALPSLFIFGNSKAGKCVVASTLGLSMMRIFYTVLFAAFVFMFVVVVVCYTCIIVTVKRSHLKMEGHRNPATENSTMTQTASQIQPKAQTQPRTQNPPKTQTHIRTAWTARDNRVAADPHPNDLHPQPMEVSATPSSGLLENRAKMFSCSQTTPLQKLGEETPSAPSLQDPAQTVGVEGAEGRKGNRAGANSSKDGADNLGFSVEDLNAPVPEAVQALTEEVSAEAVTASRKSLTGACNPLDRSLLHVSHAAQKPLVASEARGERNGTRQAAAERGSSGVAAVSFSQPAQSFAADSQEDGSSSRSERAGDGSQASRPRATPSSSSSKQPRVSRHVRLTMLLMVVTAVFVVSWVPPYVSMVWYFYVGYTPPLSASDVALQTYAPTGYVLNHFANPLLYLAFSPNFRAMLVSMGKQLYNAMFRCKI